MNPAQLQKRRAEVFARAKILVSVSNSGWHKDDPQEKDRIAKGGVPITEKLLGLLDDDRVHLIGSCAEKALAGLKKYRDGIAVQQKEAQDTGGALDFTPCERHALNVARRAEVNSDGMLSLSTQDWNGMLLAMAVVGVHCTLASATFTPEEERPDE